MLLALAQRPAAPSPCLQGEVANGTTSCAAGSTGVVQQTTTTTTAAVPVAVQQTTVAQPAAVGSTPAQDVSVARPGEAAVCSQEYFIKVGANSGKELAAFEAACRQLPRHGRALATVALAVLQPTKVHQGSMWNGPPGAWA